MASAPVIGRRVGGGFEIESIVEVQRQDRERTNARRAHLAALQKEAEDERIRIAREEQEMLAQRRRSVAAENAAAHALLRRRSTRALLSLPQSGGAVLDNSSGLSRQHQQHQSTGGPNFSFHSASFATTSTQRHSGVGEDDDEAPIPEPRRITCIKTTAPEVTAAETSRLQARRTLCQSLGFPQLWSYSQSDAVRQSLAAELRSLAFVHSSDKMFSKESVKLYEELGLQYLLEDPLIAPRILNLRSPPEDVNNNQNSPERKTSPSKKSAASINKTRDAMESSVKSKGAMSDSAVHSEGPSGGAAAGGDGGEEGGAAVAASSPPAHRLGVEALVLPPHAVPHISPFQQPPIVALPFAEALESVLSHATLSTQPEARSNSDSDARHRRRSRDLYALLVLAPQRRRQAMLDFRNKQKKQNLEDDKEESELDRELGFYDPERLPAYDAIRILFWFGYVSFFYHEHVERVAHENFLLLGRALLSIGLTATSIRLNKLLPDGRVDRDALQSQVVEPVSKEPSLLDFVPFTLIHTTLLLFPIVFPASHELFTVSFFNRMSMLLNLMLTGAETDGPYWESIRGQWFAAPSISVDHVATAAERAVLDRERAAKRVEDDVGQLRKLQQKQRAKAEAATEALLRPFEDSSSLAPSWGDHGRAPPFLPPQADAIGAAGAGSGPLHTHVGVSKYVTPIYRPPFATMPLGDPEFHLLNDAVLDIEHAADVVRVRNERGTYHQRRATTAELSRLKSLSSYESGGRSDDPELRVALYKDLHERYQPSATSPRSQKAQDLLARNVAVLKQAYAEALTAATGSSQHVTGNLENPEVALRLLHDASSSSSEEEGDDERERRMMEGSHSLSHSRGGVVGDILARKRQMAEDEATAVADQAGWNTTIAECPPSEIATRRKRTARRFLAERLRQHLLATAAAGGRDDVPTSELPSNPVDDEALLLLQQLATKRTRRVALEVDPTAVANTLIVHFTPLGIGCSAYAESLARRYREVAAHDPANTTVVESLSSRHSTGASPSLLGHHETLNDAPRRVLQWYWQDVTAQLVRPSYVTDVESIHMPAAVSSSSSSFPSGSAVRSSTHDGRSPARRSSLEPNRKNSSSRPYPNRNDDDETSGRGTTSMGDVLYGAGGGGLAAKGGQEEEEAIMKREKDNDPQRLMDPQMESMRGARGSIPAAAAASKRSVVAFATDSSVRAMPLSVPQRALSTCQSLAFSPALDCLDEHQSSSFLAEGGGGGGRGGGVDAEVADAIHDTIRAVFPESVRRNVSQPPPTTTHQPPPPQSQKPLGPEHLSTQAFLSAKEHEAARLLRGQQDPTGTRPHSTTMMSGKRGGLPPPPPRSNSAVPASKPILLERRPTSPSSCSGEASLLHLPEVRDPTAPRGGPDCTIVRHQQNNRCSPFTNAAFPTKSVRRGGNRPEMSSSSWLSMTAAVKRTRQHIDDATRIRAAQDEMQRLLQQDAEGERETQRLRRHAQNRSFDDEMSSLKVQLSDPLRRTALVNEWIAREPPKREPDPTKHAAILTGTLLAEEAQHTSLFIREGLKRLEVTFAQRRRRQK